MFLVGDSDAQKTFRTYLNYVQNVATFIGDEYGSDPTDRYANVYAATLPLLKSVHPSSPTIRERQYLKGSIHNLERVNTIVL